MVRIALTEMPSSTPPEKQASRILQSSGIFSEHVADEVIRLIKAIDLKAAFNYAPDWIRKYLKGIARMTVEEAHGTLRGAVAFLSGCMPIFENYLMWVREVRPEMKDKERLALDRDFIDNLSYAEVKAFVDKMYSDMEEESDKDLSTMEFGNSDHTLVPINTYREFNSRYGGAVTGDEEDEETFWCHANGEGVFNEWVDEGENQFFVVEKDGWENIPYEGISDGNDEYGNSLIAILVDKATGKLKRCTLRSNHLVEKGRIADNFYKTYAQLSNAVGFNVKDAVREYLNLEG